MNSEGCVISNEGWEMGDLGFGGWRWMEMQRTHFPSTILGSRNRNVFHG